MLNDLDQRDTTLLKGLAITAIVFHNFFHLVSPVRENEFAFDPVRFHLFLGTLGHPALFIQAFFSFFGHFGVQVFIFLSAYGLAKSHWEDSSLWTEFMWSRVKKLYPMFLLIYVVWLVLVSTQVGFGNAFRSSGLELACMLTGLSNILPGHHMLPVGPWWFIPFIIQFYAIWPLMRRLTIKFGWPGLGLLAVLSLVFTQIENPVLAQWGVNVFETPIGRMSSLCFGIAAARYPMRIRAEVAVCAFAILIAGSLYREVWPVTFFGALIVSLFLYSKVRERLRNSYLLQLIGSYSMLLFLWNGVVRVPFVEKAQTPVSQLALGCISAVVTFATVVLIQEAVRLANDFQSRFTFPALNGLGLSSSSVTRDAPKYPWSDVIARVLFDSESGFLSISRAGGTSDSERSYLKRH